MPSRVSTSPHRGEAGRGVFFAIARFRLAPREKPGEGRTVPSRVSTSPHRGEAGRGAGCFIARSHLASREKQGEGRTVPSRVSTSLPRGEAGRWVGLSIACFHLAPPWRGRDRDGLCHRVFPPRPIGEGPGEGLPVPSHIFTSPHRGEAGRGAAYAITSAC